VTVTNTGTARVEWATDIVVQGTIREQWNATGSAVSGTVRFVGVSSNRELAPGGSTQFGFCVNRSAAGGDLPPAVTITINPASITIGQSTTVSWSSTNATACTASGAWSGARPTAGSQSVTATTPGTLTYSLACAGSGGTTTRAATLTVTGPSSEKVLPGQVRITSDWGAGYCADVTVTNASASPIQWQVTVPIDGALTQVWNAVATVAGGQLTAQGLSWNSVVQPAATVAFGFCASRTGSATATTTQSAATATATPAAPATATPVIPATATRTRTATAAPTATPTATRTSTSAVSTATPTRTATAASGTASAQVVIRDDWGAGYCADVVVSTAGPAPVDWRISVPITGTLTQLWNAIYTVSGGVLTAEGLSWNNLVYPSQPVTFGFCADR
jgi:cellulase/cellobiase CelA1